MNTFSELCEISRNHGETMDCTVKATALACRIPYEEAHAICAEAGRKPRQGAYTHKIADLLEHKGYRVKRFNPRQPNGSRYTPKTIGKRLNRGHYMCQVRGHVFAVVDGKVLDWTNGRNHRIERVYKVTFDI